MTGFVNALLENWRQVLVGGAIVISAVIVIMGMIKKLFDKVPNKYLRKFLLALTSVVLVLPVSAIYFVCAGIDYQYFWGDYALLAGATIITYWLYENTCLRELIQKIGSLTLGKFFKYVTIRIQNNEDLDDESLEDFAEDLQSSVDKEITSSLPNLFKEQNTEGRIRIPISSETKPVVLPNRSLEKEENELKIL